MNLKMRLLAIFTKAPRINFGEIKYFYPSGRTTLPNGHPIQKGGFLRECRINNNSFEPSLHSGYCIVFPANLLEITPDGIRDLFVDCSVTYIIGNHFKGQYAAATGEIYNEKSITIGVDGLSSRELATLVEYLSKRLPHKSLLIKDFSNNKIFIAHVL